MLFEGQTQTDSIYFSSRKRTKSMLEEAFLATHFV